MGRRRVSLLRYFAARALGLFALFQAAYPIGYLALLVVDAVSPRDGMLEVHRSMALTSAVLALVFGALAWWCDPGVFRLDRRRFGDRGRPGAVALVLAVIGLLGAAYGLVLVTEAMWFDFTYFEAGHVGASFSAIGIGLAYVVVLPVAACLLAAAATSAHRAASEPVGLIE